jgi:hypothetical protein
MNAQAKPASNDYVQASGGLRRTNTSDLQQVFLLLAELQRISKSETPGLNSYPTIAAKATELRNTVPKAICLGTGLV